MTNDPVEIHYTLIKRVNDDDLELNINTLDLYSLKELKKIRANIKKEETFSSLPKDTIKILNKRK